MIRGEQQQEFAGLFRQATRQTEAFEKNLDHLQSAQLQRYVQLQKAGVHSDDWLTTDCLTAPPYLATVDRVAGIYLRQPQELQPRQPVEKAQMSENSIYQSD